MINICYHTIRYHTIRYDMLWWHMVQKKWKSCFFKIVRPCWGYVWVSSLVILRPSKKWKKLKILCFPKVVYWPLGYDLASSLIIFSPEINIFENLKKYFSKFILFYYLYDMIAYDMISYDMISYDMIWYHMISYDMIWYHMISYHKKS